MSKIYNRSEREKKKKDTIKREKYKQKVTIYAEINAIRTYLIKPRPLTSMSQA